MANGKNWHRQQLAKKWVRFILLGVFIAASLNLLELPGLVGKLPGFGILALTMIPEVLALALACSALGISISDVIFTYLYVAALVLGSIVWARYFVYRTRVLEILCARS